MDIALIKDDEALVNITWQGQNGDLPDPVPYGATDGDIYQWATEAVRAGIPGIAADPNINFEGYMLDRYLPNEGRAHNMIYLRPKTPYGR